MRVTWRAWDGTRAYRLEFRDNEGSSLGRTEALREPSVELEDEVVGALPENAVAQLEIKRSRLGSWEAFGPPSRLSVQVPGDRTTMLRWDDSAPIHRLQVFDRTVSRILLDEPVLGSSFPFRCPGGTSAHDLVMRARPWTGEDWAEPGDWRPLPLSLVLGETRGPPPSLAAPPEEQLLLVFTIDTECSILRQRKPDPDRVVDELIFGDFGDGQQKGIGLQMDLLEHFGHRGCFFLDILMEHSVGQAAVERVVEAIASRGHEIQLHFHPEHLGRSPDPAARKVAERISASQTEGFAEALELSANLFQRRTGSAPVAYRAGGFRIRDEHFPMLESLGMTIDSSIHSYFHSEVSEWMRCRTQPFWVGGVLEVPPTWILLRDEPEHWEVRTFAPNPSMGDPVSGMRRADGGPPLVANFVSHSFQLLRASRENSPEDIAEFGRRLRAAVPSEEADRLAADLGSNMRLYDGELDDEVVSATAGILRRISDRFDARCVTLGELAEVAAQTWPRTGVPAADPIPALDRHEGSYSTVSLRTRTRSLLRSLSSGAGEDTEIPLTDLLAEAPGARPGRCAVIADAETAESRQLERDGADVERLTAPSSDLQQAFDAVFWPRGFEQTRPEALDARLEEVASMLRPGGRLVLGIGLLGERARPAGSPPATHLLFPDLLDGPVAAWDATTFRAWLGARRFRPVAERLRRLPADELAALAADSGGLTGLSRGEMEVVGLDVVLARDEGSPPQAGAPHPDPAGAFGSVPLEALDQAAARLRNSIRPGEERELLVGEPAGPATRTTTVFALTRAGLRVAAERNDDYGTHLTAVRPLELDEVEKIAWPDS